MDADTAILDRYGPHFERINRELEKTLVSRVPLLVDMGSHSLLGQGKRLRPLLFVLSAQLCRYPGEDVYRLAGIFEYIHTASLLHDDVLDNADVRRRKESANRLWGNHAAVLEGDFLYAQAFASAIQTRNFRFLRLISDISTQMTEGQVLELIHTFNWEISRAEYLAIATAKTGVLISAACAAGAVLSGAEEPREKALAGFGLQAGIAFQLMDDLLDYTASQAALGKPVAQDLKEGKITLPLIYTLARQEPATRERLKRLFQHREPGAEDLRELLDLVRRNGAIEKVRAEAREHAIRAAEALAVFPDCPAKESLLELNQFIVDRSR